MNMFLRVKLFFIIQHIQDVAVTHGSENLKQFASGYLSNISFFFPVIINILFLPSLESILLMSRKSLDEEDEDEESVI